MLENVGHKDGRLYLTRNAQCLSRMRAHLSKYSMATR
jgi:hypothetical protein